MCGGGGYLRVSSRVIPEEFSGQWNGTQQRVLDAIKQGVTHRKAIGSWLGIGPDAVTNALRRLADKNVIRAVSRGHYELVLKDCPLADAWQGVKTA